MLASGCRSGSANSRSSSEVDDAAERRKQQLSLRRYVGDEPEVAPELNQSLELSAD
jgi:hypothetical protein